MDSDGRSPVRVEQTGSVLVVTLTRPAVRNAVDLAMAQAIEAAIDRLESDPELHVGVVAGEGSVFCAGGDLRVMAEGGPLPYTERGGFAGLERRERTKPLVVACEGAAVGGGFELVLACDIVIASTSASFGLPEITRGLFPGGGGSVHLGVRLPTSVAMSLNLTGESISAERAHQLGLVSDVVAPGQALPAALAVADRIAQYSPFAVGLTRRVVDAGRRAALADAWAVNAAAMQELRQHPDFRTGPRAFVQHESTGGRVQ